MLRPENHSHIAELTRLVARNAFPKGSVVMTMRDELGPIFEEEGFADLYPNLGQPAESPGRLALVTVMQFNKNLTDRQAAQAVRGRIDWKHALGLELWVQQFYICENQVYWRTKKKWGQPSAGKMIASTQDLEAKYCAKRTTEWSGHKVRLTETCDKARPHLITQVETTGAT